MKIYVKLRSGQWILVSRKIELTYVKSRKVSKSILAGEVIESPRVENKDLVEIEIPAGIVNKIISRLLDLDRDEDVLIEPRSKWSYVVMSSRQVIEYVKRVIEEVSTRKTHRETS